MTLRPATQSDADAVGELLRERDAADFGHPYFTRDDLVDAWRQEGFDLGRDAAVHETSSGVVAGYAMVRRRGTFGVVAPSHEGLGIGSELVAWSERRQRELGWQKHVTGAAAASERAAALLRERGYGCAWTNSRLSLVLPSSMPRSPTVESASLRVLEVDRDAADVHAIDGAAFGESEGSLAAFYGEHLKAHDAAPDLSRVAIRDGQPVGFALVRRRDPAVALVSILAVLPQFQGRGIGRAIVHDVFRAALAESLSEVQIGVASDNPRAAKLYASLGMRPLFDIAVFERPLARETSDGG